MKKSKERGITLIALVITIIVLLILAGVTISLIWNGGIIDKSQQAVDTYSRQTAKEKLELALGTYNIGQMMNDSSITFEGVLLEINGRLIPEKETDDIYVVVIDGYEFEVPKDILSTSTTETTQVAKISNGNNLTGKSNGTLNGKPSAYNNPIIPAGFKAVNWSLSSDKQSVQGWNDGLIITDADSNGNEFVWVPAYLGTTSDEEILDKVPEYKNVHESWEWDKLLASYQEDSLPTGISTWWSDVQLTGKEAGQIKKYGGFYIARYEAGTTLEYDNRNTIGIPLSKENQIPWNNIDYSIAKTSAESMYNNSSIYPTVKSGLLTGKMWDTVGQWYEKAGLEPTREYTTWGNYGDTPVTNIKTYSKDGMTWKTVTDGNSITKPTNIYDDEDLICGWLLLTGETTFTRQKNIYDMAGNLTEYTNEVYIGGDSSKTSVARGGSFYLTGSSGEYMTSRDFGYSFRSERIGFRVALYIQ